MRKNCDIIEWYRRESTACEGLATVHVRVSSGTIIRPTIDELEGAHREIFTAQVYERLRKIGVAHASM